MTKNGKKYLLFFCLWGAVQSGVFLAMSEWIWVDMLVALSMSACCMGAAEIIMGEK